MINVVAVFGLSGVGKSWLSARFAESHGLLHLQASHLLKNATAARSGVQTTSEQLRTGAVIDNQELLISAFQAERQAATKAILFDGHCLIDGKAGLIDIPASVIEAIAPCGIIFVHAEPATIFDRRVADTSRERPSRSAAELHDHQERARAICTSYAEGLKLPMHTVEAGDETGFASAVAAIFST